MEHAATAAIVAAVVALAGPAFAADPVEWDGQGSENLPCEYGGHWVLAPSFGVESPVLTVDGLEYPMTQHGEGAWSADSLGPIDDGVVAFVTFAGEGDERNHLQLSHCTEGETSESPSPSPSPESPSPESPSPSESETPTPIVSVCCAVSGSARRDALPPTGATVSPWLFVLIGGLVLGGLAAMRYGSLRSER